MNFCVIIELKEHLLTEDTCCPGDYHLFSCLLFAVCDDCRYFQLAASLDIVGLSEMTSIFYISF